MSSLTRCNYCDMKALRKEAKESGMVVSVRQSTFLGGKDVWVHPKDYKIPPAIARICPCDKYPNGNEAYSKYHRAWFKAIGKGCSC